MAHTQRTVIYTDKAKRELSDVPRVDKEDIREEIWTREDLKDELRHSAFESRITVSSGRTYSVYFEHSKPGTEDEIVVLGVTCRK